MVNPCANCFAWERKYLRSHANFFSFERRYFRSNANFFVRTQISAFERKVFSWECKYLRSNAEFDFFYIHVPYKAPY